MTNETLEKMWNILKENDFQINVAVISEIKCTSCKNILIKPCNVPCGCRYCHDCLINYLNGEEKFCLGESEYCKNELINIDKNVFIDQAFSIKISRIVVKCPLESCELKTELGKMADHMRTCDRQPVTCPYNTIGCHDDKIDVDKMKEHLKQENYSHARLLIDFVDNWRNEMKLLKTNMLDLQEENKCTKEQMESNQKTILALEENVAKLLKENKSLKEFETEKSHQNNQTKAEEEEKETGKVKEKCEFLEENQEQMKTKIEELFQENKSLRNELEILKQDKTKQEPILSFQTKTEEQKQGIKKITKKIEDLKQRFDEKWNQVERNQEQMKIKIDKMTQENADMATQSKQIKTKLTQAQANQNCGEFLWCIKNWKEKMESAEKGIEKEIYSEPFYSHKNGYKMCLKLNCQNLFFGNCNFYFYICIMRGEFDNILQWPFRHGVKLDLLNQKTGLAHVSKNVCSENNPNHESWEKPTSERNKECGGFFFGGYLFISQSELLSNADMCQDDQIWIKATSLMKP